MSKQILRKHLETRIEGNKETIVNERIELELLTIEEQQLICETFEESEYAIEHGVYFDFDDNLDTIILKKIADEVEIQIKSENFSDADIETFKVILKKIEPYEAYTLYFE